MAYNLQSLITILQQILNPEQTRWIVDHNKPRLESLLQKAETLQQILEKSPLTKIENLESQIRDAVYQAEDIIESHMVDQMLSIPEGVRSTFITPRLRRAMPQSDSLTERVEDNKLKQQMIRDLESQMADQMLSNPQGVRFTFITPDLEQVIQQLDSATEQVVKLVKGKTMLTGSSSSSGASSSHDLTPDVESLKLVEVEGKKMPTGAPSSSSNKYLVGVEADLEQLRDRLRNMESKLEIIPITGMGGIGKTTLARNLYEDRDIVSHFGKYRGWATISQDYNMRAILLSLLRCIIGKETEQLTNKKDNELKHLLRESLYNTRYMIVLDDIWSTKFSDEIRLCLPDNNNRSRIVITTRESDVVKFDHYSEPHKMQLLSKSESWNLLRQIVFGEEEEDCHDHVLQEIGTKIAGDCGGLPLAITVIGGLLSNIERSKDAWENIGKDVIAPIAELDERCSNILSLSYNNLPNHLKPCFLYMAAFPEDFKIKGSRLVRMWVAEGFVRSNIGNKSLEEEAEDCLKSLVERNLFMVGDYKSNGKPKSYIMHDLLRDLCIRKCNEEKFLHVKNGAFSNPRRVSADTSHGMKNVSASAESMSLTRSFIVIGRTNFSIPYYKIPLRLVRVLDIMDVKLREFPKQIFEFVNLRLLAFWCRSRIPRRISRLGHLQILIAKAHGLRCLNAPLVLGHIEEMINVKKKKLLKLQVIRRVELYGSVLGRGFFISIPNIKKLGIEVEEMDTSMEIDLSHLHKLEIIKYRSDNSLPKVRFPCNIKKLFLERCVINRGVLRTLCELHKLEVLKIMLCKFEREETCDGDEFESEEERYEEEWEATDGDEFKRDESENEKLVLADGDKFPSLLFLSLEELEIVRWKAKDTNFPKLHRLHIKSCYSLKEIPSGFGEISNLQLIEIDGCRDSLVATAREIEEQQIFYGNCDFKLSIKSRFTHT